MAYSRWPHRTHKASKYKGLQLPSLCLKCSQGHWSSSKHLRPIWKCLTTRTLEKSGLLPNFIAFSRLGIGQLSTPRLATLSWATAAHLPYVNTLSCWVTVLALLRLLFFLPAVANKTHLEHGQYVQEYFGGFRAQGLDVLSHKDMDFHGHEKGAECATCTFAAEL